MMYIDKDFHNRYIYIKDDKDESILVIDILNGIGSDEGGLYLWHFNHGYVPENADLNDNGQFKIIGVDII